MEGINVVRSKKARRLSISVKQNGEVRLTIPSGVSDGEARDFVESKKEWIEKNKRRMVERFPVSVVSMPYSTRGHSLRLLPQSTKNVRAKVVSGVIIVTYPLEVNYQSAAVQEVIKKGVEEAWRVEAKEYIPARIAELSRALGFKFNDVTIRNTRTRWGSCSARNSISLSLHLMKLPDELIDYIIIHELCHTVVKNHGPKFHKLLDKCTGGQHTTLRKTIKTYTTRW